VPIVLIVNDNPQYQQMLDPLLQGGDTPAEVRHVHERSAALENINSGEIATLVIDPYMGKMCAGDLVGYMEQYNPATPIIISTAAGLEDAKDSLASYSNILHFMSEPCQSIDLLAVIQQGLLNFRRDEGISLVSSGLASALQHLADHCRSCRLEVIGPDGERALIPSLASSTS